MQTLLEFVPAWPPLLVSDLGHVDFRPELPEFPQPHGDGRHNSVQDPLQGFAVQQVTVLRVMKYFIGARGQRNLLALFEWDFEQLNNLAAAMILEPIQFV